MRKAFLILFWIVLMIGVSAGALLWYVSRIGGSRYDPSDKRDMQKLRVIAESARPLREWLELFKKDHDTYPGTAPIPSSLSRAGWHYQRESTNSYSLYYQLNWDDGLFYEHLVQGTNRWFYAGGKPTEIDLTRDLEQK